MAELTIEAKVASEALGVTTYDLALTLRKAAVSRMAAISDQIKDPARDRDTKLHYFDEMIEETRRLLAAAEACDADWWNDLGMSDGRTPNHAGS